MKRIGAERRLRKMFNRDLADEVIWTEIILEKKLNNIQQLKSLIPEAARGLIEQERRLELLSLGISELSEEVARELIKYKGDILLLNNVKELTPETAAALSLFKGVKLGLNGLKKISPDVLKGLAPYKGILLLESLEDLGIDRKNKLQAEKIFKLLKTSKLCLNGIKKSSLQMLRIIAKIPGELELNGIRQLSPSEAAGLVSHKGKHLKLRGLTAITAPLARILVKYKGSIDIGAVKKIESEAVNLIISQPGNMFILHPAIKRRIDEFRKKAALKAREKEAAILKEQKEKDAKKKEIREQAQKLLKEFEEFDDLDLPTAAPQGETFAIVDVEEKPEEDKDSRERRLNFEIMKKKNELNALLRKPPESLTKEENQQVTELRKEINFLKDEIKDTLDLLIEKREVGTLCFSSSNDLAKYLKDSGAEDDENNALEKLDVEEFDLFGGSTQDDDIDIFGGSSDGDIDIFGESSGDDIDIFGDASETQAEEA